VFSKHTLTIWIYSDVVKLVLYKNSEDRKLVYSGTLEDLIGGSILEQYRNAVDNACVVVPDEWVGNTFFPFQSSKKKYVKPFVLRQLRKLTGDDENLPHYNYYFFSARSDEKKGIYVYYLTRQEALQVVRKLELLKFNVSMVTTPGLLWGEKLKVLFKKKKVENVALLLHGEEKSHLLMYYKKCFAFSRGFDFNEYSRQEEAFDSLVFEINQSLIYFSQKYKSEIEVIVLIDLTTDEKFDTRLQESIGKEIAIIDDGVSKKIIVDAQLKNQDRIQHWVYFSERDFVQTTKVPNLLPDDQVKNICYSCFERAGIVVGSALCLIFLIQVGWMQFQYRSLLKHLEVETKPVEVTISSTLSNWTDAANEIVAKANYPSVSGLLLEIGEKDIPFLQLKTLEFDWYQEKHLRVEGSFRTEDVHAFREGIEMLLKRLRTVLPGNPPLSWDNVRFQRDNLDSSEMCFVFEIRANL